MKDYTMFNYSYLFGDHFAKISQQAKLYYINLNFYANNGFVSNPMSVLDSLGYDKSVYYELINNGELLSLPDRCEVFIAAYFLHNKGLPCYSWRSTPYAVYWENKLHVKKNGVATFNPSGIEIPESDPLDKIMEPKPKQEDDPEWDEMVDSLEGENKNEKLQPKQKNQRRIP